MKSKLTNEQRLAAKAAAEEKAALEFNEGWEAGIAGEANATTASLVYEAGYFAGHNERVRRAKEEEKSDAS